MNFIEELKRRKVIKVGITYAVVAFIFMQLVEIIFPIFNIPLWVSRLAIILIVMGFPIVFILAWIFDVTPDGIVKTESSSFSRNIKSVLIGSLQLIFLLALVLGFTNPKENETVNEIKKRLILTASNENKVNEFIKNSVSIKSYLFFSIGRTSIKDYDYNITHGFLGKVYISNLLPIIFKTGTDELTSTENKDSVKANQIVDSTVSKEIEHEETLSEVTLKKEDETQRITSLSNIGNEEDSQTEISSVTKNDNVVNEEDPQTEISSVTKSDNIGMKNIRRYDFSSGIDIIASKKLTKYIARASFGSASIYEYPVIKSQIISTIYSGESIYVFPIFREGFLLVGKNNKRPLGYMRVEDIQFSATDRLGKIKALSRTHFLGSSQFESR